MKHAINVYTHESGTYIETPDGLCYPFQFDPRYSSGRVETLKTAAQVTIEWAEQGEVNYAPTELPEDAQCWSTVIVDMEKAS